LDAGQKLKEEDATTAGKRTNERRMEFVVVAGPQFNIPADDAFPQVIFIYNV
jgi:hypothetical protein